MKSFPTIEEIRRVREWECKQSGHDLEIIQVRGSMAPHGIICSRCGSRWGVTHSNEDWGFKAP